MSRLNLAARSCRCCHRIACRRSVIVTRFYGCAHEHMHAVSICAEHARQSVREQRTLCGLCTQGGDFASEIRLIAEDADSRLPCPYHREGTR